MSRFQVQALQFLSYAEYLTRSTYPPSKLHGWRRRRIWSVIFGSPMLRAWARRFDWLENQPTRPGL